MQNQIVVIGSEQLQMIHFFLFEQEEMIRPDPELTTLFSGRPKVVSREVILLRNPCYRCAGLPLQCGGHMQRVRLRVGVA